MRVILSPHFDDAVYSIGGSIAMWTQASEQVMVLNVMGGEPIHLPDSPIVRDLHQRWAVGDSPVIIRQREDAQALSLLGARFHHLPIADCVYRTNDDGEALYPSEASLFGAVHVDDSTAQQLRARNLEALIGVALSDCYLYAPCAVGNHIDHQIVRDWALALRSDFEGLYYYADYPYTQDMGAIRRAHAQLPGITLQASPHRLSKQALEAKITASMCYISQTSTFWKDDETLRQEMIQAFTDEHGHHQELMWKVE